MHISVGFWDTRKLSNDMSDELANHTLYFTKSTACTLNADFPKGYSSSFMSSTDVNEIVNFSSINNADYLIIFPAGTIMFDPAMFCKGFVEFVNDGSISLAGHIIDHGISNTSLKNFYGLHEQCMILSKSLIADIKSEGFVINDSNFLYQDDMWPDIIRSESNVHDNYTPMWIKKNSDTVLSVHKSINSRFCLFHDLIKFTLNHGYTVHNLSGPLRAARQYAYHLDNPTLFEKHIHSNIVDIKNNVELPQGQIEFLKRWKEIFDADTSYWAYNTESIFVKDGLKVDCFVTVASGVLPYLYLLKFDLQPNTDVIFVDINKNCIDFQKFFLEHFMTTSENYEEILQLYESNKQLKSLGGHTYRSDEMIDLIKSKWDIIKSCNFHFYCGDITKLPDDAKTLISKSTRPYVWFSNVMRYIGSLDKIYDDSYVQAYLTELLRLNLNINWSGTSLTNDICQGPNSKSRADQSKFCKELQINIPFETFMDEIAQLESMGMFTSHRSHDLVHDVTLHRGWSSFVIHGIGHKKTEGYEYYGYKSDRDAPYHYTDEAMQYCPNIIQWLTDQKFKDRYHRVRIMKLDPNGMVGLHNDNYKNPDTWATNLAINNPDQCEMHFWNRRWEYMGIVPWGPGKTFKIKIGDNHCVINKSTEARYHFIIHGEGGWI